MRILPVADPGDPDTGSAFRFLRWLARQHAAALTAGTLWACLWMAGMAVTPFAIGRAVDAMIARDRNGLLLWSAIVLAIGLGVAAGSIMRHRCDTFVRLGTTYRTMQLVTRQATRLGAKLDKRVAAGEIVAVSTTDIQQVGYFIDALARGIASAI